MKQFFLERTVYIGLISTLGIVLMASYFLIMTGGNDTSSFSSKFLLQYVGLIVLMELLDFFVIDPVRIKKGWKYPRVMAGYLLIFLGIGVVLNWFPIQPQIILSFILIFIIITYVINRYSVFRWKEEEKKWNEYIEKINQQV